MAAGSDRFKSPLITMGWFRGLARRWWVSSRLGWGSSGSCHAGWVICFAVGLCTIRAGSWLIWRRCCSTAATASPTSVCWPSSPPCLGRSRRSRPRAGCCMRSLSGNERRSAPRAGSRVSGRGRMGRGRPRSHSISTRSLWSATPRKKAAGRTARAASASTRCTASSTRPASTSPGCCEPARFSVYRVLLSVGDTVSEVDAEDGHRVGPVVTGAP